MTWSSGPSPCATDNHLYRELEVETKPQQSWTAVCDGARGLAVVSVGLMESAVRDLPERPIALTLFRGTRRTVITDGEPNGQLLGDLHFRYWIVPVAGEVDRVRLCDLGQQLAAGLRDVQLRPQDVRFFRADLARGGVDATLPAVAGFLSVEGPAVVTSIRQVGEGLEVRMFNPNPKGWYRHPAPGRAGGLQKGAACGPGEQPAQGDAHERAGRAARAAQGQGDRHGQVELGRSCVPPHCDPRRGKGVSADRHGCLSMDGVPRHAIHASALESAAPAAARP